MNKLHIDLCFALLAFVISILTASAGEIDPWAVFMDLRRREAAHVQEISLGEYLSLLELCQGATEEFLCTKGIAIIIYLESEAKRHPELRECLSRFHLKILARPEAAVQRLGLWMGTRLAECSANVSFWETVDDKRKMELLGAVLDSMYECRRYDLLLLYLDTASVTKLDSAREWILDHSTLTAEQRERARTLGREEAIKRFHYAFTAAVCLHRDDRALQVLQCGISVFGKTKARQQILTTATQCMSDQLKSRTDELLAN